MTQLLFLQEVGAQYFPTITIGTTGNIKGVVVSHKSIAFNSRHISVLMDFQDDDRQITYVPFTNMQEQLFNIYVPIHSGAALYFPLPNPGKIFEALFDVI